MSLPVQTSPEQRRAALHFLPEDLQSHDGGSAHKLLFYVYVAVEFLLSLELTSRK